MIDREEFISKLDGSFKKKLRDAFYAGQYYDSDMLREPDQTPSEAFDAWYRNNCKDLK